MSSAFTPSLTSIATVPTSMTDVEATRLGLKSYAHGTTYNGGIAPTVTLDAGGGTLSTVNVSDFIPYQMQSGTWRLKFNMHMTVSATSRTAATFGINGVTFYNQTGAGQAIVGGAAELTASTTPFVTYVLSNTSQVKAQFNSGTITQFWFSGDVKLDSKPTWAY